MFLELQPFRISSVFRLYSFDVYWAVISAPLALLLTSSQPVDSLVELRRIMVYSVLSLIFSLIAFVKFGLHETADEFSWNGAIVVFMASIIGASPPVAIIFTFDLDGLDSLSRFAPITSGLITAVGLTLFRLVMTRRHDHNSDGL
jgi:hypothetical protein